MTIYYSMVIKWSEEDSVFVVTLPEFQGPQTHGKTYEESAKNGKEVLELLVDTYQADGRILPPPKTLESSSVPVG